MMRRTMIGLAGATGIALATLAAPAVLQAHENGASKGGMMMQDGSGMMDRMSRMMDRCESMMDKMGGDGGHHGSKPDDATPKTPGTSG